MDLNYNARSRQRQRRIGEHEVQLRPPAETAGERHASDDTYSATSTPHFPRRGIAGPLPDLDISVIPDPLDIDEDSNSNMNITVIQNIMARPGPAPAVSSGAERNAFGDIYTSDEDTVRSGSSSGSNARSSGTGSGNDGNNNTKVRIEGGVSATATMVQNSAIPENDVPENDVDFLFATALEFTETPGKASTNVDSPFPIQPPLNPSSPPLLGAMSLSPHHYFRLNQARKREAALAIEHASQGETNKIDDVVHKVQNLGIKDFSDSSDSSEHLDSDPDYEVPMRVPTPAPTSSRKLQRGGLSKANNLGGVLLKKPPGQLKQLPEELRGSVDHGIKILQRVICMVPKKDVTDELGSPASLKVELFPHQRYGLVWLWWREQHTPYGGILADEMGLGKTVMMLALCCRGIAEGRKDGQKYGRHLNGTMLSSRGTLVICPASVMGQWELEVKKKCRRMNVLIYHGQTRPKDVSQVAQHDIVITTYDTVRSEVTDSAEHCGSPLIKIHWERIVLDEGHIIRNPTAGLSLSACRLNARHRWIVTGTPVHNKPGDMFSLVKFLRLEPFDDIKTWESWIGTKLVRGSDLDRLNTIAKSLMLRRTKDEVSRATIQGASGLQVIPVKTVLDIGVTLKPEEKQIYDHLFSYARQELRDYIKSQENRALELQQAANGYVAGRSKRDRKAHGEAKSFMSILTLLLRLKQCAVLPHLLRTAIDKSEDMLEESAEFDPVKDLMSFKNPVFSTAFQSAKLDKVYEDLDNVKRKCKSRKQPMEKVVIVSQWTSLLHVVQHQLSQKGYSTTSISGQVKIKDRTGIVQEFNENPKRPQIMLLSLGTGSVGLNLIGANHLYILDLHWNPQLELQAQDRIHRFGQTKPVTIHRYISQATVEEQIVNLQKLKLELASSVLGNSQKKDSGALTVAEVRQIFGL